MFNEWVITQWFFLNSAFSNSLTWSFNLLIHSAIVFILTTILAARWFVSTRILLPSSISFWIFHHHRQAKTYRHHRMENGLVSRLEVKELQFFATSLLLMSGTCSLLRTCTHAWLFSRPSFTLAIWVVQSLADAHSVLISLLMSLRSIERDGCSSRIESSIGVSRGDSSEVLLVWISHWFNKTTTWPQTVFKNAMRVSKSAAVKRRSLLLWVNMAYVFVRFIRGYRQSCGYNPMLLIGVGCLLAHRYSCSIVWSDLSTA